MRVRIPAVCMEHESRQKARMDRDKRKTEYYVTSFTRKLPLIFPSRNRNTGISAAIRRAGEVKQAAQAHDREE